MLGLKLIIDRLICINLSNTDELHCSDDGKTD